MCYIFNFIITGTFIHTTLLLVVQTCDILMQQSPDYVEGVAEVQISAA